MYKLLDAMAALKERSVLQGPQLQTFKLYWCSGGLETVGTRIVLVRFKVTFPLQWLKN